VIYEKIYKIKGVTKRIPLPPFREVQLEMPRYPMSNDQNEDVIPERIPRSDDEVVISIGSSSSRDDTCIIDFKDTYSW